MLALAGKKLTGINMEWKQSGENISSAQSSFVRRSRTLAWRHPARVSVNTNMLHVPWRSYSASCFSMSPGLAANGSRASPTS